MGMHDLDSSALVKRYAREAGSSWIASLTDPSSAHSIFVALVTGAEMVAAVTRKMRAGAIRFKMRT